jgi:hypothetical protein
MRTTDDSNADMPNAYYILCECGGHAEPLMHGGEVLIYATRRAAHADVAHMRLLMEGGPRTRYTVKAAR